MIKKSESPFITRILKLSVATQMLLIPAILVFTNSPVYCIITLSAATIGVTGFVVMIIFLDRVLKNSKGRGKGLFFFAGLIKLTIISLAFYLVSRISETAVLFYILGLSVIVISLMMEGLYQIYRSFSNGTSVNNR